MSYSSGSPDTVAGAARATAEPYDWRRAIARYFELYDELHELVRGCRSEPRIDPAFYSTEGNRFGLEVR